MIPEAPLVRETQQEARTLGALTARVRAQRRNFLGRLRQAGQFLRIPGTVSQFLIPPKKLVQNPVLSF